MKSRNRLLPCFMASILFSICLISCQDSKGSLSVNVANLHSALDGINANIRHNENLMGYIVLPGEGCLPCIAQMEERLMQDTNTWKSFGLIFTRTSSIKLLREKPIGVAMLDRRNVYVDRLNLLDKSGFDYIYPSIIYLNSGQFGSFKLVQNAKHIDGFK